MSGSGPAIDGQDIYLATGNGMDPGTMPGNFGECFVKLRYTAGAAGVNNGKPTLTVADFWGAFSDFGRADEDADLGAAGVVLLPETGNLIGSGKDGILYNLDKNNLGKDSWNPQFNLPFVATYLPNQPNSTAGLPTTTAADPNWPIVNRDRNLMTQTPTGKTHHIHGTPVFMQRATTGIVYLWGENERLKAYDWNLATKRITTFRGEGTQFASGNMPGPGGMPGGRLVGSSNGNTVATAVIWGVYPTQGNANSNVVHGALVAYDAVVVNNGKMKQLFHSDANAANDMGNFAKYATPVVANGKVYVATFSNKVVQYRALTMRKILAITAVALTSFQFAGHGQAPAAPPATVPAAQQPAAPAAETPGQGDDLKDLDEMTFGCPKAGLNAAAREAAKAPSQGTCSILGPSNPQRLAPRIVRGAFQEQLCRRAGPEILRPGLLPAGIRIRRPRRPRLRRWRASQRAARLPCNTLSCAPVPARGARGREVASVSREKGEGKTNIFLPYAFSLLPYSAFL